MTLTLTVNNTEYQLDDTMADVKLLDFLHDELNLTGSKFCCGIGVCRACTVAVRPAASPFSEPVISCSTPLALLNGSSVTTVEGVAQNGQLHPLQEAFLEGFAFQCGYCTPGFLMASLVFLDRLRLSPVPIEDLDDAIAEAIGTHICRCTGYKAYVASIRKVALETMLQTEAQL